MTARPDRPGSWPAPSAWWPTVLLLNPACNSSSLNSVLNVSGAGILRNGPEDGQGWRGYQRIAPAWRSWPVQPHRPTLPSQRLPQDSACQLGTAPPTGALRVGPPLHTAKTRRASWPSPNPSVRVHTYSTASQLKLWASRPRLSHLASPLRPLPFGQPTRILPLMLLTVLLGLRPSPPLYPAVRRPPPRKRKVRQDG